MKSFPVVLYPSGVCTLLPLKTDQQGEFPQIMSSRVIHRVYPPCHMVRDLNECFLVTQRESTLPSGLRRFHSSKYRSPDFAAFIIFVSLAACPQCSLSSDCGKRTHLRTAGRDPARYECARGGGPYAPPAVREGAASCRACSNPDPSKGSVGSSGPEPRTQRLGG